MRPALMLLTLAACQTDSGPDPATQAELDALRDEVAELRALVEALPTGPTGPTGTTDLSGRVAALETDQTAQGGRITALEASQTAQDGRLDGHDTALADSAADIATNTADIATNTADIATNTADIATNTADIATHTTDIAANAAGIAANAQDIADAGLADVTQFDQRVTDLETKTASMSATADTVQFSGVNLQLVDGSGSTDCAPCTGLGNLIVGYHEDYSGPVRTGSHNVLIGADHGYDAWGGLAVGLGATAPVEGAAFLGQSFSVDAATASVMGSAAVDLIGPAIHLDAGAILDLQGGVVFIN